MQTARLFRAIWDFAFQTEDKYLVAAAARTTPSCVRIVDRRIVLAGYDVLVRDEAAGIEVGGEHLISQDVLMSHIKIWLRLVVWHVSVLRVQNRALRKPGRVASNFLVVKAVHPAVSAGNFPGAVARGEKPPGIMGEVPCRLETDRLENDLLILRIVTVRHRPGAGIAIEQVVQASILLNDNDDVLDLSVIQELLDRRLAQLRLAEGCCRQR